MRHEFASDKSWITFGGKETHVVMTHPPEIAPPSLADKISRKLWRLDGRSLCERARHRSGLDEFGDPPIEPPLSILTKSLEQDANLHPLGRFLMRVHLLTVLESRLRLAAAWKAGAGGLTRPIERPVFITGMPRSGSTFLHELLSQDPANRSPKVWEVMFPVPAPEADIGDGDPRVRRTNACLWWFRRLVRGADEVYPLRACMPHECVAIHSFTLMSEEFVSTCHIPDYEKFLRTGGMRAAYAWQKRFLQHLQSRCPSKQWILKSPDHLHYLEDLFAVFPDALVIQTHRNPIEVLSSSLQLTKALRGLFGRPDTTGRLMDRESRVLAEMMERSMHFRDGHPALAARFMDLSYADLVSDPLAAVSRIYEHLDCPLTQATILQMRQFIVGRSRYRRRNHSSLADHGLDVRAEMRRFQNYCRRFGVPMQPA